MPYLLILLTLVFASCKNGKVNALSDSEFTSPLAQKSFLTIKNEDEIFYFRGKVLNSFVEEKIPSGKEYHQLKFGDELTFVDLDQRDKNIYKEKETNEAKVIVSYLDRTEVYFLPENISLAQIISKLNLIPDPERYFKWVKTDITKTYKGSVLYLVSLNIEDIIVNDQSFYKDTIDLNNNFAGQKIKLSAGRLLTFDVKYSIFTQVETVQDFEGTGIRCNSQTRESGDCGKCYYQRNVAGGATNQAAQLPLNELGFAVKLGDKTYEINNFKAEQLDGSFRMELNSSEFDIRKDVEVELVAPAISGITKITAGYNYRGSCESTNHSGAITLGRSVTASVTAKLWGRGKEILKNIL